MRYFRFSLKKISRNKLTIIPFILITLFIVFIYTSNHILAYHNVSDPEYSGVQEVSRLDKDIEQFKIDIKKFEPSSQKNKDILHNLQMAETRRKYLRQRLDAFDHKIELRIIKMT